MKISIITPTYNSSSTIETTLKSVSSQTYPVHEHLIIDGKSTDNTLDKINKEIYPKVSVFSESDEGIYDAMNKGITKATGDIVGILNSDDLYYDNKVLEKVAAVFKKQNVQCVFGDIVYVDKNDTSKIVRYWKGSKYIPGGFRKGWHPAHSSFFVKKEVYDKYGLFRTDLKIAADFEIMLRFLEKYQLPSVYIPEVLVKMRLGGESNRSIGRILEGNRNCRDAFKLNGLKIPTFYTIRRLVPKIAQFFKKPVTLES